MAVDIQIHEPGDNIFVMYRGELLAYQVTGGGNIVTADVTLALVRLEEKGFVGIRDGNRPEEY